MVQKKEARESLKAEFYSAEVLASLSIFCDFDGTITFTDSLKYLLRTYAAPTWMKLERQLMRGEVAEREALRIAFQRFPLTPELLHESIERSVEIDPHFHRFSRWVKNTGIEFTILSGGFESIIDQVFEREKLPRFPRLANQLVVDEKGWAVHMLSKQPTCGRCSHCKGDTLRMVRQADPSKFLVYIGDGVSDLCALQVADLVLAKGFLADYCDRLEIPHMRFDDFSEVSRIIESSFQPRLNHETLRTVRAIASV